jgi:hypothetical protein
MVDWELRLGWHPHNSGYHSYHPLTKIESCEISWDATFFKAYGCYGWSHVRSHFKTSFSHHNDAHSDAHPSPSGYSANLSRSGIPSQVPSCSRCLERLDHLFNGASPVTMAAYGSIALNVEGWSLNRYFGVHQRVLTIFDPYPSISHIIPYPYTHGLMTWMIWGYPQQGHLQIENGNLTSRWHGNDGLGGGATIPKWQNSLDMFRLMNDYNASRFPWNPIENPLSTH